MLDGVDLDLAPGSVTAIIGPSGAGKSTLLRTARRIEWELTEERVSFMQDACPRDLMNLPVPYGRIVIGLDGGYIRDVDDRKKNFELIVGRSLPEDGAPRGIGFRPRL